MCGDAKLAQLKAGIVQSFALRRTRRMSVSLSFLFLYASFGLHIATWITAYTQRSGKLHMLHLITMSATTCLSVYFLYLIHA